MSGYTSFWGRVSGNREVSRKALRVGRGDLSGAACSAYREEEGSREKHGFFRGSAVKRSDERGVFA